MPNTTDYPAYVARRQGYADLLPPMRNFIEDVCGALCVMALPFVFLWLVAGVFP